MEGNISPEPAAYIVNSRIVSIVGAKTLPFVHLVGGGPRSLGTIDFLRHEAFTDEESARVPTGLQFTQAARTNFTDFAFDRRALILSNRAAGILERLEPGKHQIFPLKIEAPKRYQERLAATGYVLVNVCSSVQAVDLEKSTLEQNIMEPPRLIQKQSTITSASKRQTAIPAS